MIPADESEIASAISKAANSRRPPLPVPSQINVTSMQTVARQTPTTLAWDP